MVSAIVHPDVAALASSCGARLIVRESSALMRAAALLVRRFNPDFLTGMTTTLWSRVYMPAALMADGPAGTQVLRHEAVHIAQFKRHPVWLPLSYLFVAPFGWTMRARWEWPAYLETMRVEWERTGTVSDATLRWIENLFCGPAYLFMDLRRSRVRTRLRLARQSLVGGEAYPSP